MASQSQQHKITRVRRPRVQITYDVETNGAMEKKELPFVVGVMADLSGQPKDPLPALKERKFTNIDRDNFHDVLRKAAPRLAFGVENKLTDAGGKMNVELTFKHLDDFDPDKVAAQVGPLKELLDMRHKLTQLLGKLEGNDKLAAQLEDILGNTEKAQAVAKELGVGSQGGN